MSALSIRAGGLPMRQGVNAVETAWSCESITHKSTSVNGLEWENGQTLCPSRRPTTVQRLRELLSQKGNSFHFDFKKWPACPKTCKKKKMHRIIWKILQPQKGRKAKCTDKTLVGLHGCRKRTELTETKTVNNIWQPFGRLKEKSVFTRHNNQKKLRLLWASSQEY